MFCLFHNFDWERVGGWGAGYFVEAQKKLNSDLNNSGTNGLTNRFSSVSSAICIYHTGRAVHGGRVRATGHLRLPGQKGERQERLQYRDGGQLYMVNGSYKGSGYLCMVGDIPTG